MSDYAAPWRLETDLSTVTVVDAEGLEVGFIKGPISRSQLVAAAPELKEVAEEIYREYGHTMQAEHTERLDEVLQKANGDHPSTFIG